MQFLPELAIPGLRQALGGTVGLLAVFTACAGLRRWRQVEHAIRRDLPLPRSATPTYLVVSLVIIGVVTIAGAMVSTTVGA